MPDATASAQGRPVPRPGHVLLDLTQAEAVATAKTFNYMIDGADEDRPTDRDLEALVRVIRKISAAEITS
jgi:hypothetical protein